MLDDCKEAASVLYGPWQCRSVRTTHDMVGRWQCVLASGLATKKACNLLPDELVWGIVLLDFMSLQNTSNCTCTCTCNLQSSLVCSSHSGIRFSGSTTRFGLQKRLASRSCKSAHLADLPTFATHKRPIAYRPVKIRAAR